MSIYTCIECNSKFERVGNKDYRYCSRKCYGKAKRVPLQKKKCSICGKVFEYHHEQKNRKYCSRECVYKSLFRSIEKKCLACGKKFFTRPSANRKYCSPKCFYERTAGKRKQASGKKYIKIYIKKRGNVWEHRYVMENKLGRRLRKSEHVHHIDGNPKNNDIKNLLLVTPSEHAIYNKLQREIKMLKRDNKRLRKEALSSS